MKKAIFLSLLASIAISANEQRAFNMGLEEAIRAIDYIQDNNKIELKPYCLKRARTKGYKDTKKDIVKDAILSRKFELKGLYVKDDKDLSFYCIETNKDKNVLEDRADYLKGFFLKKGKKRTYIVVDTKNLHKARFYGTESKTTQKIIYKPISKSKPIEAPTPPIPKPKPVSYGVSQKKAEKNTTKQTPPIKKQEFQKVQGNYIMIIKD